MSFAKLLIILPPCPKKSCQNYFSANLYSSDQNVHCQAKQEYRKKELLSQLTLSSYVQLESKVKHTLNITLSKEYAKGTLVHISDDVFEWFLDLQQERVNLLNNDSVAIHGDNLVEHGLSIINKNDKMKGKWHALFAGDRLVPDMIPSQREVDRLGLQLFKDVVTRYIKIGVAEFLRQFREDSKLQKTEAHQKKVVEKKGKKMT